MFEKLFSMEGKVCVITGGSRGLGAFMAKGFLQAGAKRVFITARKAEACIATAEELSQYGECIALPGDISVADELKTLVETLSSQESCVDVLVNNAGSSWGGMLGAFPEKGWDKIMDLNVKSPFFLTQAMLPLLKNQATAENTASVINIGSVAGLIGDSLNAYSYGPSKAALHQLTRNLAKDLADDHIRVNAIAPGRFVSKMTEYVTQDQTAYEAECKEIPLHRFGNETDIAGVAIMLASQAGEFITGQVIPVDGGATLVS